MNSDLHLGEDTAPQGRGHHRVYVVELPALMLQDARFEGCNPDYRAGKPCVCVGMTGLDPDVCIDKRVPGVQSNSFVMP